MIPILVGVGIVFLLAVNIAAWKFGFIHMADKPELVLENPNELNKEQKAVVRRINRWKSEGKLTREEQERFLSLVNSNW